MSVTARFPIVRRKWQGWTNAAYPTGFWIAGGTATGDAGGGSLTVILEFNLVNAKRISEHFSLERLAINDAESVNRSVGLSLTNFDVVGTAVKAWRFEQVSATGGKLVIDNSSPRIFMGSQRVANLPVEIVIVKTNAPFTWNVVAEGYVWGARSLSAEGGFGRPADGLYSD